MKSFKDKEGRQWDIEIGLAQLALVKSRTGLDLQHLVTGDIRSSLGELADPAKLFDVLLALTEKQRTERTVDPDAFGAALNDAELVELAMEAVIDGTIDFFPVRSRDALRSAFATVKKVGKELRSRALDRAEELLPQLPALGEKLIQTLSKNAGDSPESSESTRDTSVGDS